MLEPLTNAFLITMLMALLAVAVAQDVRARRIANRLVVVGLVAGLVGHTSLSGAAGFGIGSAGACVGLLCLLPFYIQGGMGAGDVKLMAMCGAFLGPVHVIVAAVASLLVGGVLGVGWFFFWQFSAGQDNATDETRVDSDTLRANQAVAAAPPIPYALAIVAGVLIALMAASDVSLALAKGFS